MHAPAERRAAHARHRLLPPRADPRRADGDGPAGDRHVPAGAADHRARLAHLRASVQVSLAVYFIGIAVGQAFYGPLSDRLGRKPALYFGLVLFMASSVGCALAGRRAR